MPTSITAWEERRERRNKNKLNKEAKRFVQGIGHPPDKKPVVNERMLNTNSLQRG